LPTSKCKIGDTSPSVLNLQKYLANKKYLNPEHCTGYYGVLTSKAVLIWQLERWQQFDGGVKELLELEGKYWGAKSVSLVN